MEAIPSLTLVLMGRTGNGKSATGNSILGKKAFTSRKSPSGVTKTSSLESCVWKDGQVINVIDTPGMFDLSGGSGSTAKELMKCIELASEGIHAVILVFSVRNRFTQEEEATIQTLQNTFGPKIVDYTIVVLTGGDEFEDDDDLENYLTHDCPVALKDILTACKNRCVIFDNKTKSEEKKDEQMNELLELVKEIMDQNGGQPYKPLISVPKLEKEFAEVKKKLEQSCTRDSYSDPKLEEELNELILELHGELQRQLEEERDARRQVEEKMQQIQRQYDVEARKMNEILADTSLQTSRPPLFMDPPNSEPLQRPKSRPQSVVVPPNSEPLQRPRLRPSLRPPSVVVPPNSEPLRRPKLRSPSVVVPPNSEPLQRPKLRSPSVVAPPNSESLQRPRPPSVVVPSNFESLQRPRPRPPSVVVSPNSESLQRPRPPSVVVPPNSESLQRPSSPSIVVSPNSEHLQRPRSRPPPIVVWLSSDLPNIFEYIVTRIMRLLSSPRHN